MMLILRTRLLSVIIYALLLITALKKSSNLFIFSDYMQRIFIHQCHNQSPGQYFSHLDFSSNFLNISSPSVRKAARVLPSHTIIIIISLRKTPHAPALLLWYNPNISSHSRLFVMLCASTLDILCLPDHNAHRGVWRCMHLLISAIGWKVPEDKNYIFIFVFSNPRLRITLQGFIFTKLVNDCRELEISPTMSFLFQKMEVYLIR